MESHMPLTVPLYDALKDDVHEVRLVLHVNLHDAHVDCHVCGGRSETVSYLFEGNDDTRTRTKDAGVYVFHSATLLAIQRSSCWRLF